MDKKIKMDIQSYPQAAILASEGQILALNDLAKHYLPGLEVGGVLPEGLDLPEEVEEGIGSFCAGRSVFEVRGNMTQEGMLFLFHPIAEMGLSRVQLDNALGQMRALMGEFLMEIGPYTKPDTPPLSPETRQQFSQSYHRMLRLMENMEYVNDLDRGMEKTNLDVVRIWRMLTEQVETLLRGTGTTLEFVSSEPFLMVYGDEHLLRRMFLGLLSNAMKAARGGRICVKVSKWGNRVLLQVEDSADTATQRHRMAMVGQDTGQKLPLPDSGAGLGMAVIREIVRRHQGTLMVRWDEKNTRVVIALPRTIGSPYLSVQSPRKDPYGGFHELMVELADVLPGDLYAMESME